MSIRIIISIVAWLCALTIVAQPQLPAKVEAKLPELLKKAHPNEDDLNAEFRSGTNSKWGQKRGALDQFWIAYSDRDNNTAYMSSNTNAQKSPKKLSFGDKVFIAKIENDMALVYTDTRPEAYPKISSVAKSVGWVPMDNLLLWNTCPADKRGVTNKALIAIKLNEMQQGEQYQGRLYKNPDDHSQSQMLSMDMNFYFVMKMSKDDTQALLCLQSTFTGNNLYGWVKKNSYTPWKQRTCLEPNWSRAYVEGHKGTKMYVYPDENAMDANGFATYWEYGWTNGDENPFMQYRMKPDQLRFPILDVPNSQGVVRCTSFADKTGSSNISGGIGGNINDISDKMMHMNLIFVVEATTKMKDYFPSIKSALLECKTRAKTGMTVKAGIVLYRGTAQGNGGIESVALTNPDDARLVQMLDASKANGSLTGSDASVALSQAIERAADKSKMGIDKDERTLIINVGYHGDVGEEELTNSNVLARHLSDNNIQLMSVQMMRTQTGSCQRYNDQMLALIKENADMQYKKFEAEARFFPRNDNTGFQHRSNKQVLFAQLLYNNKLGEALTPAKLKSNLNDGVSVFANTMEAYLSRFEKSANNIDFDPAFLKHILGERGFSAWKAQKAISAYDGYARLSDSQGEPYWHYILYLSAGELEELIKRLQPAAEAARQRLKDRKPYIDAMKGVVRAQLKEEMTMSDKDLENMTPEQLDEKIYGINIPTESMDRLTGHSIKEISNMNTFSNADYDELLNKVSEKYERLKRIQNSDYRYKMTVSHVDYYWIPLEELP